MYKTRRHLEMSFKNKFQMFSRHLSKYSKIYEERGCITIRYSAPGEYVLFDPDKIRYISWFVTWLLLHRRVLFTYDVIRLQAGFCSVA